MHLRAVSTVCPRCEQGAILAMIVKSTRDSILVCNECEATWLGDERPSSKGFRDFGAHMKALGLKPLWEELESPRPGP